MIEMAESFFKKEKRTNSMSCDKQEYRYIVLETTADLREPVWAIVELTDALLTQLREWRKLLSINGVISVTLQDDYADWVGKFPQLGEDNEFYRFISSPQPIEIEDDKNITYSTVRISSIGIAWSCMVKHDEVETESALVSWEHILGALEQ